MKRVHRGSLVRISQRLCIDICQSYRPVKSTSQRLGTTTTSIKHTPCKSSTVFILSVLLHTIWRHVRQFFHTKTAQLGLVLTIWTKNTTLVPCCQFLHTGVTTPLIYDVIFVLRNTRMCTELTVRLSGNLYCLQTHPAYDCGTSSMYYSTHATKEQEWVSIKHIMLRSPSLRQVLRHYV